MGIPELVNCSEGSFSELKKDHDALRGVSFAAYKNKIRNLKHRTGYFHTHDEPAGDFERVDISSKEEKKDKKSGNASKGFPPLRVHNNQSN